MKKYYIAYGSNLNKEQMKYRCPKAKPMDSTFLEGYELTFKYFLTIERKEGARTPVGIWEITDSDEEQLDTYEGYPSHYRKEYLKLEVDGEEAIGLVYVMNNIRGVTPPSDHYLKVCYDGYKNFGLDTHYLLDALRRSQKGRN